MNVIYMLQNIFSSTFLRTRNDFSIAKRAGICISPFLELADCQTQNFQKFEKII